MTTEPGSRRQYGPDGGPEDGDLLVDVLRNAYPYGHPNFAQMQLEELALHSDKNHDYAAGGDPLGNFRRVGAILAQYPGLDITNPVVVALIYAIKQWDASLWMLAKGNKSRVGEDVGTRLKDIHAYVKLARLLLAEGEENPRD